MEAEGFDPDMAYESWRDDALTNLDDDICSLIDTHLNHKGGYYEGREDKLFSHAVSILSLLLHQDAQITRLSTPLKRVEVKIGGHKC